MNGDMFQIMDDLILFSKKNGASDVDVKIGVNKSFSFGSRLGKTETIERSESSSITLRLYQGKKKQVISASNLNADILKSDIKDALSTISELPEDPYCGLASSDQVAKNIPDLDINDPNDPSEEKLLDMLLEAENTALGHKGITNSEGGSADWDRYDLYMLSSNGFKGHFETTDGSISIEPVAGSGDNMQISHDFSASVYFSDLKSPKALGDKAAEKVLAKMNPKKIKTGEYPVVYHSDIGGSLLGLMMEAINGSNIAKGISFLKDKRGQQIFKNNIHIIDNPHVPRGLGSKPFDGEGFSLSEIEFVKDGILNHWMLDLVSARKMNLIGDASHPLRGSAARTNLIMQNGDVSFQDLIADIKQGFLVTELMSRPESLTNGDYSVGASGFMIENGKIAYPIHEATLSSNLIDMYANLVPANDLMIDRSTKTPSLFIPKMTVAGA